MHAIQTVAGLTSPPTSNVLTALRVSPAGLPVGALNAAELRSLVAAGRVTVADGVAKLVIDARAVLRT